MSEFVYLFRGGEVIGPPEQMQQHMQKWGVWMKELGALREKSGSAIANAIAYDSEYAQARANKRYAEEAAERKGCDLTGKPPAKPPEATAPEAKQAETKKQ